MQTATAIVAALFLATTLHNQAHAAFAIASNGIPRSVIVQQPSATDAEKHAAKELQTHLQQITGATLEIKEFQGETPDNAIIIGPGTAAAKYFPELDFKTFGPDELVMRSQKGRLLLAGGRPRGTIYAVNRFLHEQCGVRWWTSWARTIPANKSLSIPDLNLRYQPPFEYRATFWYPAFDPLWKVRNGGNNEHNVIPRELGGCIQYKGFAHTFYQLISPNEHFEKHPEWFSMIEGKRTTQRSQLCLTHPQLRDEVVKRVKEWLRESPDAQIVSVTQNDHMGWCECPNCKALDDAEESHAGTMISFANYIAEKIEPDFPNLAVDTFAYQYTRKPPKTVKPRRNVIVRLCSIECNFREPLDHASNAAFADDIRKWSQICKRLYIWDYTTDFKNYVHPHPNWFTLGPNVRFFQKHGVKGVFEQGPYADYGAEMAEMRSWVLAQLLWNPQQDDRALIREFLEGYYGAEAGKLIYRYLELVHQSSEGLFLGCYLSKEPPPHLRFSILGEAELLWQQAENSVSNDAEKLARVRLSHLPVRCAYLKYWNWLRHNCWEQNAEWPLPKSRKAVAEEFRAVTQGVPGKEWTKVRMLNEPGLTVETFLKDFAEDPKPLKPPPPVRLKDPPPPADLAGIDPSQCIDLQDNIVNLAGFGKWASILHDQMASDRRAVWMPGDHSEWAFRIPGTALPEKALSGKWKVYAVIRAKKNGEAARPDSIAFTAGVYDTKQKTYPADFKARLFNARGEFHSYLLGEVEFNRDRDIYVAPASNPRIMTMWVDRIYLVPAE
jgi:hypothetical protein